MSDELHLLGALAKSTGNRVILWAAAEIARLRDERRWIPVTERLPDLGVDVLVSGREGVFQARLALWGDSHCWEPLVLDCHGCGCCGGDEPSGTHWQPLPEPPKGGKGAE